jgi:hypothetical protein
MSHTNEKSENQLAPGRELTEEELDQVSGAALSASALSATSATSTASLASSSLSIFNGLSACKNNTQRTAGF